MGRSITPAVEEYLKAIYLVQQSQGVVLTNQLCLRLGGLRPGSVSGMLRRLAERALIEHDPYHGVRLTDTGAQIARTLIRHHRLIECYLVTRLGYPCDEVHAEAERLEHAISPRLAERMAAMLGHPTFDPHGAPILPPERLSHDLLGVE